MRLTGVAALAGIGFSAVHASEAYVFDISRFYPDNSVSAQAIQTANSTDGVISHDEFVLRSSGEIARSLGRGSMNATVTKSVNNSLLSTQSVRTFVVQEPAKFLNTLYSNNASEPAIPKCGPSPLSPAEIEALVGATAATYAIDVRFAKAIAWAESRFDQVRNSPKGARGPMQLMPSTAVALGVQDPCDPKSNIDGGIRHLKALIDEFQNPLLAAAAYNAGSRAVYDNGGIPPYGETIRYVATVINHQLELRHGKPSRHTAITMRHSAGFSTQASDSLSGRSSHFVKGVMHF
jgi:hypothetical protein